MAVPPAPLISSLGRRIIAARLALLVVTVMEPRAVAVPLNTIRALRPAKNVRTLIARNVVELAQASAPSAPQGGFWPMVFVMFVIKIAKNAQKDLISVRSAKRT